VRTRDLGPERVVPDIHFKVDEPGYYLPKPGDNHEDVGRWLELALFALAIVITCIAIAGPLWGIDAWPGLTRQIASAAQDVFHLTMKNAPAADIAVAKHAHEMAKLVPDAMQVCAWVSMSLIWAVNVANLRMLRMKYAPVQNVWAHFFGMSDESRPILTKAQLDVLLDDGRYFIVGKGQKSGWVETMREAAQ